MQPDLEKKENTTQAQPEQAQAQSQAQASAQDTTQQETVEQINWRKYREAQEEKRKQDAIRQQEEARRIKELEAQTEAMKRALEVALDKKNSTPSYYQDQGGEEDEIAKKIQQEVQRGIEAFKSQMYQETARKEMERLPSQYPDFEQVCSTVNLDYIAFHYPHVAQAMHNQPDSYQKWDGIYNTVKKLVPSTNSNVQNLRADYNASKPKSAASVSGAAQMESSQSDRLNLSPAEKAQIYAEAQRKVRGW